MGNFGIAFGTQAIGLARQPFQIAMLAIVDDGVGFELMAEPEIKREIAMGRNEGRVMVGGLGIDVVTACRLDADGHIAVGLNGKVKCAIAEEGIGFRNVPARGDLFTDGVGEMFKMNAVGIEVQLHVIAAQAGILSGWGFRRAPE